LILDKSTGLKIFISISNIQEAGNAIFSGFFAAKVFGVFSANTRMTKVRTNEAMITEPSPKVL